MRVVCGVAVRAKDGGCGQDKDGCDLRMGFCFAERGFGQSRSGAPAICYRRAFPVDGVPSSRRDSSRHGRATRQLRVTVTGLLSSSDPAAGNQSPSRMPISPRMQGRRATSLVSCPVTCRSIFSTPLAILGLESRDEADLPLCPLTHVTVRWPMGTSTPVVIYPGSRWRAVCCTTGDPFGGPHWEEGRRRVWGLNSGVL